MKKITLEKFFALTSRAKKMVRGSVRTIRLDNGVAIWLLGSEGQYKEPISDYCDGLSMDTFVSSSNVHAFLIDGNTDIQIETRLDLKIYEVVENNGILQLV